MGPGGHASGSSYGDEATPITTTDGAVLSSIVTSVLLPGDDDVASWSDTVIVNANDGGADGAATPCPSCTRRVMSDRR